MFHFKILVIIRSNDAQWHVDLIHNDSAENIQEEQKLVEDSIINQKLQYPQGSAKQKKGNNVPNDDGHLRRI